MRNFDTINFKIRLRAILSICFYMFLLMINDAKMLFLIIKKHRIEKKIARCYLIDLLFNHRYSNHHLPMCKKK